jgi:purine nucleosidase
MKRKLIIDTDPGVDDAMALMLAIKSELFDLQAITTVCGNGTIENVTRNARYVLELLGRAGIPVYSGAARPLTRALETSIVHGEHTLGNIHPPNAPSLTGDAVEKILEVVEGSHGEITLVALGPLTNVAHAIRQNSQVMGKVKEIVIMGGAVKAPGNKNRVAEFNIFVDPEAADIVFRFPVAKTIVPLDACNKIRYSLADLRAVTNAHLSDILVEMAEPYIRSIAAEEATEAAPIYDALTIYYLINPEACQSYRCHVAIETKGVLTRGMTVADLRTRAEAAANTTVVDSVDEKAFRTYFVETISRT